MNIRTIFIKIRGTTVAEHCHILSLSFTRTHKQFKLVYMCSCREIEPRPLSPQPVAELSPTKSSVTYKLSSGFFYRVTGKKRNFRRLQYYEPNWNAVVKRLGMSAEQSQPLKRDRRGMWRRKLECFSLALRVGAQTSACIVKSTDCQTHCMTASENNIVYWYWYCAYMP